MLMWIIIVVEVPLYLIWLVYSVHDTAQDLPSGDAGRWAFPILFPVVAAVLTPTVGTMWWTGVVTESRELRRNAWGWALLAIVAGYSVACGTAAAKEPGVDTALLSLVVTGLGMVGLFFIPAALSRSLPEVVRRRAQGRRDVPGDGEPDPQGR
ncbi:hypothetical protein ACXZ65_38175 [Streptomyces aculeolatus]